MNLRSSYFFVAMTIALGACATNDSLVTGAGLTDAEVEDYQIRYNELFAQCEADGEGSDACAELDALVAEIQVAVRECREAVLEEDTAPSAPLCTGGEEDTESCEPPIIEDDEDEMEEAMEKCNDLFGIIANANTQGATVSECMQAFADCRESMGEDADEDDAAACKDAYDLCEEESATDPDDTEEEEEEEGTEEEEETVGAE